jgi:hypothetical protein
LLCHRERQLVAAAMVEEGDFTEAAASAEVDFAVAASGFTGIPSVMAVTMMTMRAATWCGSASTPDMAGAYAGSKSAIDDGAFSSLPGHTGVKFGI